MKKALAILTVWVCLLTAGGIFGQEIPPEGVRQIQALLEEKIHRTAAQEKLESHIHWAGQAARGTINAKGIPALSNAARFLKFDRKQRSRSAQEARARVRDVNGNCARPLSVLSKPWNTQPASVARRTNVAVIVSSSDLHLIVEGPQPITLHGPGCSFDS